MKVFNFFKRLFNKKVSTREEAKKVSEVKENKNKSIKRNGTNFNAFHFGSPEYYPKRKKLKGYQKEAARRK